MYTQKRSVHRILSVLLCCITAVSVCSVLAFAQTEAPQEIGASYQYPAPEVMQLDIVMQPTAFLKMIETPRDDQEDTVGDTTYDAMVSVNEDAWQSVGIRLRGHPKFSYPGKRLPVEIRFDHAQANGAYHENPSLKLIKCQGPATLFAHMAAMEAYRFMGIPTPEMTPAFVRINGEDFGMYLAVEDINEAFIQKYYDGSGSLYKSHDEGVFLDGFAFLGTKVDHGNRTLEQLSDAMAQHGSIDAFLNVDEFLRFIACEAFSLDSDGFLDLHNYFLYDDHGRLVILPWDKDLAFQCFYALALEEGIGMYSHVSREHNIIIHTLMQNAEYQTRFYQYLTTLNTDFLDPERFLPWLRNNILVLTPFLQRDPMLAQRSENLYADLTTGNALYGGFYGNMLLTFQTIHAQLQIQIQDRDSSFYIPENCTVDDHMIDQAFYDEAYAQGKQMIRRICANYWKLRRQAFWQTYGTQTAVIGSVFIVFLGTAVVSVRVSKGGFRRRNKREAVRNE